MTTLFESEPERNPPDENWFGYEVYRRVREALFALPTYFKSDTWIEGILATDIFTLNAAFRATIEDQVISTLNRMREVWDPDEKYTFYRFVRQPQTFPDVLLKKDANEDGSLNEEILLGIELKSWYLLAKEGKPSFRFQVTPDACANQDLIVVIPWALNNVVSGYPKIFAPYVELAKYAAEYRNYHWQYIRQTRSRTEIVIAESIAPYPEKSDKITDKPVNDGGNNFGRFARTGIMDRYLEIAKKESLCGIAAEHWWSFFKIFQEQRDEESINAELNRLRTLVRGADREIDQQITDALEDYFDFLSEDDIRIKGTRIGIESVLYQYIHRDQEPKAIVQHYHTLSLEQVYATILYYLHNKKRVGAYLADYLEYCRKSKEEYEKNLPPVVARLRQLKAERKSGGAQTGPSQTEPGDITSSTA